MGGEGWGGSKAEGPSSASLQEIGQQWEASRDQRRITRYKNGQSEGLSGTKHLLCELTLEKERAIKIEL